MSGIFFVAALLSAGCTPGISPQRYDSFNRQTDEVLARAQLEQGRIAERAESPLRDEQLLRWRGVIQALLLARGGAAVIYLRNDANQLDEWQEKVNEVLALYPSLPQIVTEPERYDPVSIDPGRRHEDQSELPN